MQPTSLTSCGPQASRESGHQPARTADGAIGERCERPIFLIDDRGRLDRHGAGRIARRLARMHRDIKPVGRKPLGTPSSRPGQQPPWHGFTATGVSPRATTYAYDPDTHDRRRAIIRADSPTPSPLDHTAVLQMMGQELEHIRRDRDRVLRDDGENVFGSKATVRSVFGGTGSPRTPHTGLSAARPAHTGPHLPSTSNAPETESSPQHFPAQHRHTQRRSPVY